VHGENDLAAHIVLKHKVESFQENQEAQRENKEKDPNKREVPPLKDFEVHEDPDHATVQLDQDKVVQDKADLESREEAHVRTDHERTDHESREDQKVMCPTKETLSVENRSEDLQKMRKNLKQSQRLSGYLKTI
jgi:hypothetical protein